MDDALITVKLPAPFEVAWEAFRDPVRIREWHGWQFEEHGGLDAEIRYIYVDGAAASEADRTIQLGGHLVHLEPFREDTLVRMTRTTPPSGDGTFGWDAASDDIDEGWRAFLQQLRFALAHHWGDQRTTHYLSGDAVGDPARPPAGLDAVAGLRPGERYEATIADERLGGEVWYRSDLQVGLTVDSWGPGLLLFAAAPGHAAPFEAASLTLTTYDGDDVERSERWRRWWEQHYRRATTDGDGDASGADG